MKTTKKILALGALLILTACAPAASAPAAPTAAATAAEATATSAPAEPTAEPTAAPTAAAPAPAHLKTTLELDRAGKHYSLSLGVDLGSAQWLSPQADDSATIDWVNQNPSILMADLVWVGDVDGDGETEYLLNTSARAAGCAQSALAVDYDAAQDAFRVFDQVDMRCSVFDRWEDLGKDQKPELIAKDEDFHYAAGGAGADASYSPLKIYRYDGQSFVTVTGEFPDLIEQDALAYLAKMQTADEYGFLDSVWSSYLADMTLLGRKEEGLLNFNTLCAQNLAPAHSGDAGWTCDKFLELVEGGLASSGY